MSENKLASHLLKRRQQDYKDREYDSDDEIRKEMMTYDDRMTFVNNLDREVFAKDSEKEVTAPVAEVKPVVQPEAAAATATTATGEQKEEAAQDNQLPIILHEREIMENIENFMVTIVCGETGSGKSTQIPKFIYQAAKISPWKFKNNGTGPSLLVGITQPRRVAAVSLAKRVSEELDVKLGK